MKIKKDFDLKKYNTFSIDARAKYFASPSNLKDCIEIIESFRDEDILILGGGSNILLTHDWNGIIIKPDFKGIVKLEENDKSVLIEVQSGESWDDFVRWCVKNDYAGIENMVMIPGTVGGAVAQNIAAYGQNITDTLLSIKAIDITECKEITLLPKECGYSYRESKFKHEWQNRYIIKSTQFRLKKKNREFELSYHERAGRYGSILEELNSFAKEPFSIQDVMEAIIRQRTKRLPDVKEFGTCGSFFQNPVVPISKFKQLSKKIEDLQCYPVEKLDYSKYTKDLKKEEYVKLPAGRLLDELGWKGKWIGNVGCSEKHALCVVTNKKASSKEIVNFIENLQKSVEDNYGITLIPEVNILK